MSAARSAYRIDTIKPIVYGITADGSALDDPSERLHCAGVGTRARLRVEERNKPRQHAEVPIPLSSLVYTQVEERLRRQCDGVGLRRVVDVPEVRPAKAS